LLKWGIINYIKELESIGGETEYPINKNDKSESKVSGKNTSKNIEWTGRGLHSFLGGIFGKSLQN
jgi:hypothetical protein